ncbi:hypothetical protein [Alteribacillus iranensis]|uniref:Uncharacterized protein n=1 Tax=Alteribacillus iranensis TaxID=930128 RepID=A0A1I1ZTW9_9BACI|nr:hypothetical protein [Alteribacillus iranensis]SFE35264.1 hypothetical protein SAMN05192532_101449 [Alteribacillus iranensis]
MTSIGIVGLFMAGIAVSSWQKFMEIKDIHVSESNKTVIVLDHLVLKKDVHFFPRLLLFEKQGYFVGTVKPLPIPFLLYPVSLLLRDSLMMMLPLTYGVFSNEDNLLLTFKRKGMKQSRVTIHAQEERLGKYKKLKSLIKVKGTLKDAIGKVILPTEIKGFSGDFTLQDEEGQRGGHFYNGYFPHEYTKLFRDVDNDIMDLKDNLSRNHKILLIAMICFIFLERSR